MKALRLAAAFVVLAFALTMATAVQATTVLQMNLATMINNSDKVFVGTVIDITESRVAVGGGEVPAVTYRFRVGDTFKGTYQESKGVKFTEVKMLGTLKNIKEGSHPIIDFPLLRTGEQYLMIVAPSGPVGLTTTMGLGQGMFTFDGSGTDKVALNAANNVGLFAGMTVGFPDGVAIPYSELAAMITDIVGGAE